LLRNTANCYYVVDRDRAKIYGVTAHLLVGLVIAYLYLFAFHTWHGATWLKGLIFGAVQGAFFLTFGVTLCIRGYFARRCAQAHVNRMSNRASGETLPIG
jgi:uncharacterized membrane protein YagU involved in acid resistance